MVTPSVRAPEQMMDDVTAKVSAKGQVTIPRAVRDALGITGGKPLVFRIDDHRVTVARTKRLLDLPGDTDTPSTTPRIPWDATRRSRLVSRGKPQRPVSRQRASAQPGTEFTVDLREPADAELGDA